MTVNGFVKILRGRGPRSQRVGSEVSEMTPIPVFLCEIRQSASNGSDGETSPHDPFVMTQSSAPDTDPSREPGLKLAYRRELRVTCEVDAEIEHASCRPVRDPDLRIAGALAGG